MFEKRRAILRDALNCKDLKKLDKRDFLRAWKALAFLNNALHPDDYNSPDGGWTEELKPLAREAFRRRGIGELTDGQTYPYRKVLEGIKARRLQEK